MKSHPNQIRACDFLQTYDIFFQPVFALLIVEHRSRRVVHVGATRAPTSRWSAQQLRNATPFGRAPRFIIRDNDDKLGVEFDHVATGSGIRVLRTPARAPKANAICECFLGSVRRECLDHVLVLSERQLLTTLREYVAYFNTGRPHQGLGQRVPAGKRLPLERHSGEGVVALPILGGLHHEYRWAA